MTGRSTQTRVEIKIGDIVGGMSSGEALESSSWAGDDGGDSDKRGAGSIRVSRWDVFSREDKEAEVGIGDEDGVEGGVDEVKDT